MGLPGSISIAIFCRPILKRSLYESSTQVRAWSDLDALGPHLDAGTRYGAGSKAVRVVTKGPAAILFGRVQGCRRSRKIYRRIKEPPVDSIHVSDDGHQRPQHQSRTCLARQSRNDHPPPDSSVRTSCLQPGPYPAQVQGLSALTEMRVIEPHPAHPPPPPLKPPQGPQRRREGPGGAGQLNRCGLSRTRAGSSPPVLRPKQAHGRQGRRTDAHRHASRPGQDPDRL